jgi:hypothetical protein
MEKIMTTFKVGMTKQTPSLEDRPLDDVVLKVVTGGFAPITHVFRQTNDKREAG